MNWRARSSSSSGVSSRSPRVPGIVAVRGVQRGASRSERSVHQELHGAQGQHPALERPSADEPLGVLPLPVGHGVHAQRQGAHHVPALEDLERPQVHPGVVDPGESDLGRLLQRGGQAVLELLPGELGDGLGHEVHGVVHEHAGGLALLVSHDSAAGGVLRPRADARSAQGLAVHPRGVAVHSGQVHGRVGKRGVQGLARGELAGAGARSAGPVVLVPASAHQPVALVALGSGGLQPRHDLVHAPRALQLRHAQRPPEPGDVRVGILESGHDHGLAELDDPRVSADLLLHLSAAPDGHDLPVLHRDRLGDRRALVQGPHDLRCVHHGVSDVRHVASGHALATARQGHGCCQEQREVGGPDGVLSRNGPHRARETVIETWARPRSRGPARLVGSRGRSRKMIHTDAASTSVMRPSAATAPWYFITTTAAAFTPA